MVLRTDHTGQYIALCLQSGIYHGDDNSAAALLARTDIGAESPAGPIAISLGPTDLEAAVEDCIGETITLWSAFLCVATP